MSEAELDARIEIAREFLHDFISRPTHLKMFGAQDSDEWLRLSGFFAEGGNHPRSKAQSMEGGAWDGAHTGHCLPPLALQWRQAVVVRRLFIL